MARPSKYRIVGNDFVTLTAGQQSSQQQQQQPAPVSTQPTPVRSEVSSAHLSRAPSPRSEPSSTAVDRPATPREGAVRSLTASSALQQVSELASLRVARLVQSSGLARMGCDVGVNEADFDAHACKVPCGLGLGIMPMPCMHAQGLSPARCCIQVLSACWCKQAFEAAVSVMQDVSKPAYP